MQKKNVGLFVIFVLLLGLMLVACGGGAEPAAEGGGGDCSSEDVVCIGLVTDVGEVDDKSFNQSAWEGAQAGSF